MSTHQEWIPVTERLPEKVGEYLVHASYIQVADYYPYKLKWIGDKGYVINVTHWMPLPEPPNTESK